MKIIHCADLHLDSEMSSNLDREKAKIRKAELLNTFCRMVDYAKENQVDAIIIAGDLYDKKNISATAANTVWKQILNNPEIDFYYLKGNHDADSFLAAVETIPENLKLFDKAWKSYRAGDIVITGVELDSENAATIYGGLTLNMEDFNIVIMHGQEISAAGNDKTEKISLKDLKNKGIDYLALGHIHSHKQEKLDSRGVYCYPGCLEGRGFDECGEHGFVLLEIEEKNNLKTSFVPFAKRTLYTVMTDISDCLATVDIVEKVKETLSQEAIDSESLVKMVLTGSVDVECEKNLEMISDYFKGNYYFFKVKDETTFFVDYEAFAFDESLKGEFVRKVFASDIPKEDQGIYIRYGIQALMGEEVE